MRRVLTVAAGVLAIEACASSGVVHEGRSTLSQQEESSLAHSPTKSTTGFRRVWRAPGLKGWGLLKWDQDHSFAVSDAPAGLLQALRDEVGRVNHHRGQGPDLFLTATIYSYDRGGWFTDPSAKCELVARDRSGQVRWAADDALVVRRELAQTLVDSDDTLVARELVRKLREEFGI